MVIVIGFALNVNGYDAIRTSNEVCYRIKGGVIARAFMETNVEEELTVEQTARVAMLNRFYFLTTFKAAFGVTPHEYLSARKMERSYQLLVRGYSVTDACQSVGYQSLGTFTNLFKRTYGYTPSFLATRS